MLSTYENEFSKEFTSRVITSFKKMRFTGVTITGEFGKGKTSAAMQLAFDIFKRLNPDMSDEDIEQKVLGCMLFTRDEIKKALIGKTQKIDWEAISPFDAIKTQRKIREPVYIWDDAAIHGSKYRRNERVAYEIQSNFDQIRDATACMIITLPEADELLKTVRSYRSFLRAEPITMKNKRYMKLCFQKRKRNTSGSYRWRTVWYSNKRPIKLDDEWYGTYIKKRNTAKNKNLKEWEQIEKEEKEYDEYCRLKREYFKRKMKENIEKLKSENIADNEIKIIDDIEVEE